MLLNGAKVCSVLSLFVVVWAYTTQSLGVTFEEAKNADDIRKYRQLLVEHPMSDNTSWAQERLLVLEKESRINSWINEKTLEISAIGPFKYGNKNYLKNKVDNKIDLMEFRSIWDLPVNDKLSIVGLSAGGNLITYYMGTTDRYKELSKRIKGAHDLNNIVDLDAKVMNGFRAAERVARAGSSIDKYSLDEAVIECELVFDLSYYQLHSSDCSSSIVYSIDLHKPSKEIRTICEIQERLSNLGFAPGVIDGLVGEETRMAAQSFIRSIQPAGSSFSASSILDYLRSHQLDEGDNSEIGKEHNYVSRPENGKVLFQDGGTSMAPLAIKVAKQGYDYYIKLSELLTNKPIKTIYLRSGSSIQIKVPLGQYILKYATGNHWFGENCLFGMNTQFNKADRDFEFAQINDQLTGYSIELIVQKGGNLATKTLRPEEW